MESNTPKMVTAIKVNQIPNGEIMIELLDHGESNSDIPVDTIVAEDIICMVKGTAVMLVISPCGYIRNFVLSPGVMGRLMVDHLTWELRSYSKIISECLNIDSLGNEPVEYASYKLKPKNMNKEKMDG